MSAKKSYYLRKSLRHTGLICYNKEDSLEEILLAAMMVVVVTTMMALFNLSNVLLGSFHFCGTKTLLHLFRIRVVVVLNTLSQVLVFLRVHMLLQELRECKNSPNRQSLIAITTLAMAAVVASLIAS